MQTTDGEPSRMMWSLLWNQSAPEVEIETIKGGPLEYHYFLSVLNEAVEYKISDPHGRLARHLKFTEGEAKDTINPIQDEPFQGCSRMKVGGGGPAP